MICVRSRNFASHTEIINVECVQGRYCTSALGICRSAVNWAEEWERLEKVAGEIFCAV